MKTSITSIAKIAGGLALMAASSAAMASVTLTPHNLSASQTQGAHSDSSEICIFCHTPHGGDQSVNSPIWNRLSTSTSLYTRFSSMGRLTFDAAEAPIGSVSIGCLSCHDGTQSRDSVINGPGTGSNGNSAGATTWYDGTDGTTGFLSSLSGSDNGTTTGDLIYLGTDLRNDHPISMQYGGGGINSTATLGATRDPDFAQATNTTGTTTDGITTATGSVNYTNAGAAGARWWIDTGGTGYQSNDFPLYSRTDEVAYTRADGSSVTLTGGLAQPYVECGTCHDPHSENSTFLRLTGGNQKSQVCLTCHAR